jgi:predicted amino acid dehydrogenase
LKQIINISLGPENENYQIETQFSGKKFSIQRFGTDNDLELAEDLLLKWNKKADVLCVSGIKYPSTFGKTEVTDPATKALLDMCQRLQTLVATGETLYRVSQEWSLRHIQFQLGNSYFTNARVLFFSGMTSSTIASVMSEFTDNMVFADPVLEDGIPKLLNSMKELKLYAQKAHGFLQKVPMGKLVAKKKQIQSMNMALIKKAVKNANILVVPHQGFYEYLEVFSGQELAGKIVITTTAYDDRIEFLTDMEVSTIIDTTPKLINEVVEGVVIEALMIAAMNIAKGNKEDLLEIISEQRLDPTIIYPFEQNKRVNRFAYLIHPLTKEHLKKIKAVEILAEISPASLETVEKAMAYIPAFVYSKISGIKSPTGVEAEGWLISLGETPEQMQAHPPEFTTKKILKAALKAKKLGAQVMGLAILAKSLHGTRIDVAQHAVLPITTGNNYTASTALWATAEAVRQMGLTKLKNRKILKAKAMVVGATGDVGSICSHLLATAFEEVVLVSRNMAKLLTIQDIIKTEKPKIKLRVATRTDRFLEDMDVIVMASSKAVESVDIMRVKPGCVITDITRPMIFTAKEVAKRQDVLVITGGEILLPGDNIEMKDIGLPQNVVYANLAETIILSLEGRFEEFTQGSRTQWEKVKEIYKLGLKHGMKLASISGVDGVLSPEDIARVKTLALQQIKKQAAVK